MRFSFVFTMALLPMAAVAADPVQPKAAETGKSIAVPIRHITPGIEVLLSDRLESLKGKRVALLTNQTGVDRKGVSNVDLLRAHPAINLVALFSPEHGVRGAAQAGEKVASGIDPKSGLPVHSLYGKTKMPTAKMMQGIDIVLVDLQERAYAEAARIAGVELNTLRTRLHRGRARLLAALQDESRPPSSAASAAIERSSKSA